MRSHSVQVLAAAALFGVVGLTDGGQGLDRDEVRCVSLNAAGEPLDNGGSHGDTRPSLTANGRYVVFRTWASNIDPLDPTNSPKLYVRDLKKGTLQRIDVSAGGFAANDGSYGHVLSPKGRFIAFASEASNLVPGDTNGTWDVFLRHRRSGRLSRVSVSGDGAQGDRFSWSPSISLRGKVVAWESIATNLVPGDTNGLNDVFVYWARTGRVERVSVNASGGEANGMSFVPHVSANGRFVAFSSVASEMVPGIEGGLEQVYVRDLRRGVTTCISRNLDGKAGNNHSTFPRISRTGRYVAFISEATDLVPGASAGGYHVFIHDRRSGRTTRVSAGTGGIEADGNNYDVTISQNGRYVGFTSNATNLSPEDLNGAVWDAFVRDVRRGVTHLVGLGPGGFQSAGGVYLTGLSGNGRIVAFDVSEDDLIVTDTNGYMDGFVRRWR